MPTSSQRVVNVGTTNTPLVSAAQKRIGLRFIPGAANRYTVSFDIPSVLDQGLTINPGDGPVDILFEFLGNAVQRAWQAISAISAQNVTFYEIFP